MQLLADTVEYLGHTVRSRQLKIGHILTASFKHNLSPANNLESRSFLRLCNVYWVFVDNVLHKTGSLHTLAQKNTTENFTVNEEKTKAFLDLIKIALFFPTLVLPSLGLKNSVNTDL